MFTGLPPIVRPIQPCFQSLACIFSMRSIIIDANFSITISLCSVNFIVV